MKEQLYIHWLSPLLHIPVTLLSQKSLWSTFSAFSYGGACEPLPFFQGCSAWSWVVNVNDTVTWEGGGVVTDFVQAYTGSEFPASLEELRGGGVQIWWVSLGRHCSSREPVILPINCFSKVLVPLSYGHCLMLALAGLGTTWGSSFLSIATYTNLSLHQDVDKYELSTQYIEKHTHRIQLYISIVKAIPKISYVYAH